MSAGAAFDPTLVTAVILAGGEGRRVGHQDKGLLLLAGTPIVAHVLAALRGQAETILISANRNAMEYSRFGTVVADANDAFRGPLAGISAALERCTSPWLLTVPVDSPDPPRDLARQLHAQMQAVSSDLAVAHIDGRPEPLFALYRSELADRAAAALRQNLPVWRWQQETGAAVVDFSAQARMFRNLNTPEDFERQEQSQHD